MHEGKPILTSLGKVFKKCLNTSCLPKKNYNKTQKTAESEKKIETETVVNEQILLKDVRECMDSMLQKVEELEIKETVISLSDSDEDRNKQHVVSEIAETINKQTEIIDIDSDVREIKQERENKSDTEIKTTKEENKIEDGGQSVRVIFLRITIK